MRVLNRNREEFEEIGRTVRHMKVYLEFTIGHTKKNIKKLKRKGIFDFFFRKSTNQIMSFAS